MIIDKALTPKELEVCKALISNPEKYEVVAFSIGMNLKTFRTHSYNMYKKLRVHSRSELSLKLNKEPKIEVINIDIGTMLRLLNKKLDILLLNRR